VDEREKRHARQFEPPPWEQAAFDEFQRLKAEREQEEALQSALVAAMAPVEASKPEPVVETTAQVVVDGDEIEPGSLVQETGGISTAALETMLIGLKSQEPVVTKNHRTTANIVSALLTVGGLGFLIWAAVLFASVGPDAGMTATLASMLLMVWGFLLIAGAGLLFKKYNLT